MLKLAMSSWGRFTCRRW